MEHRALRMIPEQMNDEEREIEFSCSSEEPYNRYGFIEILSHEPGHIRLGRLSDGAALLFNHNWDKLLGVIKSCEVNADTRKLRVATKFSSNEEGLEALKDVKDGILTKVSIGYMVHKYTEEGADEEGTPIIRVTDWEPYEVSLVTVPADNTVGIGKSAQQNEPIQNLSTPSERTHIVMEPNIQDIKKNEQERIMAINQLSAVYGTDLSGFIKDDSTVERVLGHLREINKTPAVTQVQEPEFTPKEKKIYSLRNVYADLSSGGKKEAGFEREISKELERIYGTPAEGIIVPYSVFTRDLTSAGTNTGAEWKGTDHLGSEFIGLLRNKMASVRAGVRVLPNLKGNVDIPKQTSASTAYWATEVAAITESTPGTASLTLQPRKSGAYVEVSKMLLFQSDPSAEMLVQEDLFSVLSLAWDKAVLQGTGAPQPIGISGTPNIGGFTGAGLNYAAILDAISDIEVANADINTLKWITDPTVKAILRQREKVSGYPQFLMEADGTIEGYEAIITNQMTAATMLFGDFSQAILAMWGGIDLQADPYSKLEYGLVRFVAQQMVDVGVRQAGAFTYASGIS